MQSCIESPKVEGMRALRRTLYIYAETAQRLSPDSVVFPMAQSPQTVSPEFLQDLTVDSYP